MINFGKLFKPCVARFGLFRPTVMCRYSSTKSEICEFYSGKNIFITGATGFLGKVLLEKILLAFPDVGHVYILMRGKKNHTFEDRFEQLRNQPIFTKYKRVDAKNLSKIVAIEGSFGDTGLEISEKDRTTLAQQVNVVFHVASTVRFDDPLNETMKSIFVGTKSMMSLASEMRHLNSFVYVSSTFANSHRSKVEEIVYNVNIDGDSLLSLFNNDNNSQEDVEKMVRKKYFDGRPNTYCFTKALTENYIQKHYGHLPVTIARPSVVAGALSEPEPGYCDSSSALSFGLIYQALGICRFIPIKDEALLDVIPVDIVINSLLIVGREAGLKTDPVTTVYNVSTGYPLTHKQAADSKLKAVMVSPPATALRPVPRRTAKISRFEQQLITYFSELPFAIVTDTLAKIRGQKSRVLKLTRWIQTIRDEQSIFYQTSWIFTRKNMDAAIARLPEEDRKLFPADPIVKNNDEYFYNYWMSIREMVLGESPANVDAARKHQKRLALRLLALPFFATATACLTTLYFF